MGMAADLCNSAEPFEQIVNILSMLNNNCSSGFKEEDI